MYRKRQLVTKIKKQVTNKFFRTCLHKLKNKMN